MSSSTSENSQPSSFEKRCYSLLKKIPKGKVTTYKEIAQALGTTAYRAVGNACKKNPDAPQVPCHRVLKSDGTLGGYAFGLKKKKSILEQEGVVITPKGKVDLKKYGHRFSR